MSSRTIAYVAMFLAPGCGGSSNKLDDAPPPTDATGDAALDAAPSHIAKYLYASNNQDNTVSQYAVGADGTLTPLFAPTVSTTVPGPIAIDPSGTHVYVGNQGDPSMISQFAVGIDGGLLPLSPASLAFQTDSGEPVGLVIDASATYLYGVAERSQHPFFHFDLGAQGQLSNLTVSSQLNTDYRSLAITPDGASLYVGDNATSSLLEFSLSTDGTLTAKASPRIASVGLPAAVEVDATGRHAYLVDETGGVATQYSIATDGTLSAFSPASVPTGLVPHAIALDPGGRYAYVANYHDGAVSQYAIGADGGLTALSPTTIAAGMNPSYVVVDPSGRFVYCANEGDGSTPSEISQYAIGADGTLAPLTPPTVTAGAGAVWLAIAAGSR
jgi:6-phosphogluconolactonase (cycloisomerase 2 family)